MRMIACLDFTYVSGGVRPASFDAMPSMNFLIADLSMLPPTDRSRLLSDFTPAALRNELQREVSPTAGRLSEAFLDAYPAAIVESRLGPSQEPVLCLGQPGEEEQLVWDRDRAPYGYLWSE
jgi:hypothetical protein